MVHIYNGMLQKGWNLVICSNMDGTWDYCVKYCHQRDPGMYMNKEIKYL
jgi:hypothetical protein